MAKIIFEVGDVFSWEEGHGVVVGDNRAVITSGKGGRLGQVKVSASFIPPNAIPTDYEKLSFETKMIIDGARAAAEALTFRDDR